MTKVGDRIFAVFSADQDQIRLIGRGEYLGDLLIAEAHNDVRMFGFSPQDIKQETPNLTNPCFKMDDGTIVWGCECWWGPESRIDELIKDRKIIDVDISAERKRSL